MAHAPPRTDGFSRWPWWRRWFGTRSERHAARFLKAAGLRILARNVADRGGEIDLVAWDRGSQELVIVEVRSTASPDLFRPLDSIDLAKMRKLSAVALRFLFHRRLLGTVNVRFDVLAISWPPTGDPVCHHVRHAFEAIGRHQMWS